MKRVLITRPQDQADGLRRHLADKGIASTSVPTVAVDTSGAGAGERLAEALATLPAAGDRPAAGWLVLTSANGARAVVDCLQRRRLSLPPDVSLAAVGPSTAAVLAEAGLTVHYVPGEFLTAAIADGLGDVRGRRVVLARGDLASEELTGVLRARGALVEDVVAYRTVEGPVASREPLTRALARPLDGIAFTSGSTVRGLVALLDGAERRQAKLLPAFCIGPVTAAAARSVGFDPAVIAAEHTAAGLATAIADYFGTRGTS